MRLGILDEHGHLILDNMAIAKSYLAGWFLVDFASVLPIQYVMLVLSSIDNSDDDGGDGSPRGTGSQIKIAKILRCVCYPLSAQCGITLFDRTATDPLLATVFVVPGYRTGWSNLFQ